MYPRLHVLAMNAVHHDAANDVESETARIPSLLYAARQKSQDSHEARFAKIHLGLTKPCLHNVHHFNACGAIPSWLKGRI